MTQCLYRQVTSQVKLAAIKKPHEGSAAVTRGSPSLAVSPPDNTPLVIPPLPYHQRHKNLCSVCVRVHAWVCTYYVLLCVRVSTCLCIYGHNCVYISNCVFAGARTSRNHFWWISTLALESCAFSSGWLMGLLTDVCTNLLLLPLLLLLFPTKCVCESMNKCPVHWLVVAVVSNFYLWTFHSSLEKQQRRRVKGEWGNHRSLMTLYTHTYTKIETHTSH